MVDKRSFRVQVSVCEQLGDRPAALEFRREETQLYIRFRSRAYAEAFDARTGPVFWDS